MHSYCGAHWGPRGHRLDTSDRVSYSWIKFLLPSHPWVMPAYIFSYSSMMWFLDQPDSFCFLYASYVHVGVRIEAEVTVQCLMSSVVTPILCFEIGSLVEAGVPQFSGASGADTCQSLCFPSSTSSVPDVSHCTSSSHRWMLGTRCGPHAPYHLCHLPQHALSRLCGYFSSVNSGFYYDFLIHNRSFSFPLWSQIPPYFWY